MVSPDESERLLRILDDRAEAALQDLYHGVWHRHLRDVRWPYWLKAGHECSVPGCRMAGCVATSWPDLKLDEAWLCGCHMEDWVARAKAGGVHLEETAAGTKATLTEALWLPDAPV